MKPRPAWWPSPREEVLVRLALGLPLGAPDDEAAARQTLVEACAQPSDEERRLFPSVYFRFAAEVGARELAVLPAGVEERLRRAWVESRALRILALRQATEVLAALAEVGIRAAPLKGLAMDAWFGPTGRAVGDLDLLVPEDRLAAAIRGLEAAGYATRDEPDADSVRAKHSCALAHEDRAEVDLHWLLDVRLAGTDGRRAAMARYWRGARSSELAGAEVLRLRAEHHFFHTLVHGARVDSRANARWLVDAVSILRREGRDFDWRELLATATEARLTRSLAAALDAIDTLAPGLVPEAARSKAHRHSAGVAERGLWFLDARAAPLGVVRDVQRTLRWHLARNRDRGLLRGVLSYPAYLRAAGLVRSPQALLAHFRRRRVERRVQREGEKTLRGDG